MQTVTKSAEMTRGDIDANLVVNNIHVVQLNRTRQDIGSFRNAVKHAESIYYPRRRELYTVYKEIREDGMAGSAWDKRVRAIKNKRILFKNENGDIDIAMTKTANKTWFKMLCEFIVESKAWGHSLIEPVVRNGEIVDVELIYRQHVSPERGVVYRHLNDETSAFDYTRPPFNRRLLEVGRRRDLGIWLRVAPYVLYKRSGIADWATFSEMFGTPIRVYRYNPHDDTSRKEVVQQAETMGNAAYVVIPEGVEFNLVKGNDASSDAIHSGFLEAMNNEILVTLLGQTMTSANGSSRSQAEVHLHEQNEIHKEDITFVENTLNDKGLEWLRNYGYNIPNGFQFEFDNSEKLSMAERIKVDQVLNQIIELEPEQIYSEYNRKIPEGGAKLKSETININEAIQEQDEPNVSDDVNALYHVFNHLTITANISRRGYKDIKALIQDIYDGKIKAGDVDQSLFEYYGSNMWAQFSQGYGASFSDLVEGSEEYKRLLALYENIWDFSAHKVYQEIKFMAEGVVKQGAKVSIEAFEREALRIHKDFGVNYLDVEADFAQKSAQSVKVWEGLEQDKNLLPNLKFTTVGDSQVRESHRSLDGKVVPIDSPQADLITPPLDFGCRCDFEQTDEPVSADIDVNDLGADIPDAFKQNPYKTGKLFNGQHPYFKKVAQSDKENAADNFGLKTPAHG